ncbi:MAG: cupin domain-containing protein [Candidatus Acidiferrales bacterium]
MSKAIRMWAGVVLASSCAAMAGSRVVAARAAAYAAQEKTESDRVAIAHDLPPMNGGKLTVTVVEVTYGPGASSTPHSHPCPVIGYVLEGTLRTQVKGEPESIYKPGDSFYEAPNGVHQVSANASDKVPVKFLAYFVCDRQTPLSVDVPESKPESEK